MNTDMLKTDLAIDINNHRLNTYIQFKMLHLDSFKKEIYQIGDILVKQNIDGDPKSFLLKLHKYEKEHQYKYTKGYQVVAAIRIEVLLPRKLKLRSERIKFARQFILQVNPLRYDLPWLSYVVTRGTAEYMIFLLSEREYKNSWGISSYNRNYYGKDGQLLHEKGSPRLDDEGKVIKEHQLFSSKVRIFTFSKFRSFELFMEDLKQKFEIVIKRMIGEISKKYTMKKKNAKKVWHFYNRKCVTEINHVKQYIETLCNKALALDRSEVADINYSKYQYRTVPVPHGKELNQIFHKYKKRFEKGEFHDLSKTLRKIEYKKVDLETLQKNLKSLLTEFESELNTVMKS